MAFFNKLGELTKNVGEKTNDMIETGKLNAKIKTEKAAIEAAKAELGELYWAKIEGGLQPEDDANEICAKIREALANIAGFEAEIVRIKEESEKKAEPEAAAPVVPGAPPVVEGTFCVNCGAKIASGAKFCPDCGTPAIPVKRICTACGAELPADTKFCPDCGTKA